MRASSFWWLLFLCFVFFLAPLPSWIVNASVLYEVRPTVNNCVSFLLSVTIMGKSESQMDIVEKSTRAGQKPWSFVAIGLSVLLVLMTCAVVVLVILYSNSRGKSDVVWLFPSVEL